MSAAGGITSNDVALEDVAKGYLPRRHPKQAECQEIVSEWWSTPCQVAEEEPNHVLGIAEVPEGACCSHGNIISAGHLRFVMGIGGAAHELQV